MIMCKRTGFLMGNRVRFGMTVPRFIICEINPRLITFEKAYLAFLRKDPKDGY